MLHNQKTIVLSSKNGYCGMASLTKNGYCVKLSLSFSSQETKRVEVISSEGEWVFSAFGSRCEFVLPLIDLEDVGLSVYIGDNLICKGGKEYEKLQDSKNDESENTASKEEKITYQDDAICSENYYPPSIKVMRVDGVVDAVVLSKKIDDYVENNQEGLFNSVVIKRPKRQTTFESPFNKESASTIIPPVFHRQACYYERVKDKIDDLFQKCERESALESLMPESRWIKIHKTASVYYVVGLIGSSKNLPDYICYGVPSRFSMIPPTSLGSDARWLPLDVKNPQDKGYWLLFQSARSGETIRSE